MKRKKITSVISMVLVLLIVMSLLLSILPVRAFAIDQSQIDEIQKQKNELSNRVAECQNRIDLLKEEQANVLETKAALDEQNRAANEQLDLINQEIALYNDMVKEKEKELKKAREIEQDHLERYRSRIRAMEENGTHSILTLILNSENFADFLTAMDDMEEIMESDKLLEAKYISAREQTEVVVAEYEAALAEYQLKHEDLKVEQQALEQQISDSYDALAELEAAIEQAIKEYEAAEAAEAAAAATILNMIKQYNEQKRQEALAQQQQQQQQPTGGSYTESAGGNSGGESSGNSGGSTESSGNSGGTTSTPNYSSPGATGSFVWPVPCSTRVTSRFGNRSDPFTGKTRFHSGIDIDGFGNDGNIIVAADGGTVITASNDPGGYGIYVVIDHGNYTQTLYAHMSGLAVSAGQAVSQGQTIGYLGSSGRSTGTHCHYEVIINGNYSDPTAYYSGLSYWNC